MKEIDYKVITGDDKRLQTILNQWKNEYELEITPIGLIKYIADCVHVSTIIVKRIKKEALK